MRVWGLASHIKGIREGRKRGRGTAGIVLERKKKKKGRVTGVLEEKREPRVKGKASVEEKRGNEITADGEETSNGGRGKENNKQRKSLVSDREFGGSADERKARLG